MKLESAKKIFKNNFIGPDELQLISNRINFRLPKKIPDIMFNIDNINPEDYILILGCNQLVDMTTLNTKKLIDIFGFKYEAKNVCFYNQDWYFGEDFLNQSLSNKWYLIQKKIQDETRGEIPKQQTKDSLPSTILCAYTFFSWWLLTKELLWKNDFVWCSDNDRYGDRIYVGKYLDLDDEKRSGFSIHRHLAIKANYGCIKTL
jgi:hypothetical protein